MPIYEFEGNRPQIDEEAYVHPEAVLIGSVKIGRKCFIGAGAVLRADFGRIIVGEGSTVQENCVIHTAEETLIADNVVVAHGSILHDVTIETGAVVGMGAVVMHGAILEKESMVGAGSVVPHRFTVPSRKIVWGNPAEVQKDVTDEILEASRFGVSIYQELPARYSRGCLRIG